jgi:putative ABC transport system permease protein
MSVGRVLLFPALFVGRVAVQTVFLALGQIRANKTRAVLTALGIIIGVASVIAVIAGLSGMRGFVLKEFETFGARKMFVWGEVPESKERVLTDADVRVSAYEANLLLERAPSLDKITPMTRIGWDVAIGRESVRNADIRGIWPDWHEIENRQVIFGRPMSQIDIDQTRQVVLLNETAVEELKLDRDPSEQYLLLNGRRFLIIGVVETKELSGMFGGGQPQPEFFIPFTTHKSMNPYTGTWFIVQIDEAPAGGKLEDVASDAQAEVKFILRKHRNLRPEDEDTFGSFVLQNEIQRFSQVSGIITMVAGAVVSISLLVGGIGIMNIMLVSVSERTREIGLRKAVGAKPPIVLMQFLIEAVVLCLVGGLIGIAFGYLGAALLKMRLEETAVPMWAVVLSLGFSAGVGVIFGMFPAIKAARLNPIDALRHE